MFAHLYNSYNLSNVIFWQKSIANLTLYPNLSFVCFSFDRDKVIELIKYVTEEPPKVPTIASSESEQEKL